MDDVLSGKICPYCGNPTEYVDSSVIYGRSYGMIYLCRDCRAYVGVHKGTDQALGRLANAELREAKKDAHLWLSIQLGIPREICHIGMFDVKDCKRVVELCKPLIKL